ncbi:hypothetical protein KEM56_004870 [Ascosphaera pollenicola]|nr:hypothetical protein KEM56_004870 [Ascosphaera pollenicola]
MIYMATAWFNPLTKQQTKLLRQLEQVERDCLRQLTGAYKATPVAAPHIFADVPPLDLYLTERLIAASSRLSAHQALIQAPCNRVAKTFKTPVAFHQVINASPLQANWLERWGMKPDAKECFNKSKLQKLTLSHWKRRWERDKKDSRSAAVEWEPGGQHFSLNAGHPKAQSSLLTQLMTGKIGLQGFLFTMNHSDAPSPNCTTCNV